MRKLKQTSQTWLAALMALGLSLNLALADTFVCGNVSGTWTKAGGRYIVTCNLTVPSGQTLTIQPGVEVVIGQGLRIDVLGRIIAEGTAVERITFRGTNPSLYWDTLEVRYGSAGDSCFLNCKFSDATNAVYLNLDGAVAGTITMSTPIVNCSFVNCLVACVSGRSHGHAYNNGMGTYGAADPILRPQVLNCLFSGSINGCSFLADGARANIGMGYLIGRGAVNATIANCVFKSVSGNALTFSVGPDPATSYPQLVNNVFAQSTTAVQNDDRTVFNDVLAYNDFFNNQTNFIGYPPGVHGTICCVNPNGTPCDLLYNIFTDPQFCETTNYTLSGTSPCIDAGNPAGAYLDNCLTNACQKGSQGTTVNDIGIWGGPGACAPPGTTFELSAMVYPAVTIHPSTPGQYRLEYRSNVDSGPWIQATNVNLLSTPWTWIDYDSPGIDQRFYRAVLLP